MEQAVGAGVVRYRLTGDGDVHSEFKYVPASRISSQRVSSQRISSPAWPPAYVANATARDPAPQLAELGIHNVTFHRPPLDPESGKRGCFHAHKSMIEQFMATAAPIALFFEDDIVLSPFRKIDACLAVLDARRQHVEAGQPAGGKQPLPCDQWDMLLLGYSFKTTKNWTLRGMRQGSLFPVTRFWGMHAYALTQEGAKKVHALLEWRGNDIDTQISDRGAGVGLRICALYPSIMYQSGGPSTILPKALSKLRAALFAHNNGVTIHRMIEVGTVFALPITIGSACVLGLSLWLIVALVMRAKRHR
jgi:hypothetical protein